VSAWHVSGSYLESCNCEAICPCRRIDGVMGGRSTYGICLGALSWLVRDGSANGVDLSGLGERWSLLVDPCRRRKLASTPLRVAVRERRPGDGALPPGDAADADRPGASDQRHLVIGERFPRLGAEVGVRDLGVLVE